MKICPVCTNENPDTNKFCNFCGAQLSDVEPAESNGTEADPLSEIMAKMQSQEKTADPGTGRRTESLPSAQPLPRTAGC